MSDLALFDVPRTVVVPGTVDEAAAALHGIGVMSEWLRAAYVATFVDVQDRPGGIVNIHNGRESSTTFAARGIHGLTDPATVRWYAGVWLDRYRRPTPGEPVTLPSEPWPRRVPHVGNNSGQNEWYTPAEYVDLARRVLGTIELDPASSDVANETVGAVQHYTAAEDGLVQPWHGRVWMNPPYAQPLIGQFIDRLVGAHTAGDVPEAVVLVNNATDTAWGSTLLQAASAVCFVTGRVRFDSPTGEKLAPLQGQMLAYLGDRAMAFGAEARPFGVVLYG